MTLSRKIKIGLAEDNLEFCQVLNDYLKAHADFEVTAVAYDGQQALEMVRTTTLHVLLLDLIMPKLDGIAVLEQIKSMHNKPKIIILSAFGHEEMTRKTVELGADYFIVKPIDLHILVQRIREVCRYESQVSITAFSPIRQECHLEKEVTNLLQKIKIPPHFKGYTYLRKAIMLCIKEPGLINEVTRKLYPKIAEVYNSTANRVERSMRFAIETAWSKGDIEYLHELMGPVVDEKKGKPTNVSFIAKISDKIRLDHNIRS